LAVTGAGSLQRSAERRARFTLRSRAPTDITHARLGAPEADFSPRGFELLPRTTSHITNKLR